MAPVNRDTGGRGSQLLSQDDLKEVGLARPTPLHPMYRDIQLLRNFFLVTPRLPCDRFTVEHGSLLVDPSQPFHAPGETITVLCHPGYAVKTEAGNSQYFTTVCSPNLVTPTCVTNSFLDEGLSFRGTFVFSSIVSYLIVFVGMAVILFLLFLICFQQKQMEPIN